MGVEERVKIEVTAPKGELAAPDSGLNYAIRRLGRINRMLKLVTKRYENFARVSGRKGRADPKGTGTGFFKESAFESKHGRLFQQKPISVGQSDRVRPGQKGKGVKAQLEPGSFIFLNIPASQIVAKVVGKITAVGEGGGGKGGGKGGSGGGGKGGGAAIVPLGDGVGASGGLTTKSRTFVDGQHVATLKKGLNENRDSVTQNTKATKEGERVTEKITRRGSSRVSQPSIFPGRPAIPRLRKVDLTDQEQAKRDNLSRRKLRERAAKREKAAANERARLTNEQKGMLNVGAGFTKREKAAQSAERARLTNEQKNMLNVGSGFKTAERAKAQRAVNANHKARIASDRAEGKMGENQAGNAGKFFNEKARESRRMDAANKKAAASTKLIGRNMLDNVKHVTAWAAAVGVLYGAIRLARFSLESFVRTGAQVARLSQVFRGTRSEAVQLSDSIIKLAAVNGRSADEAMESAIQWSRLGLKRVEVQEAVRVSLVAANVAELSAGDATQRLSAIYATYNLEVFELNSLLSMLNQTSNTFNVTNAELLTGLTKTAAAAKQAGIPLAELIGVIGATVGKTGQSGQEIGNSVKSLIGILSNPEKQGQLRDTFDFETISGSTGEVKNMSDTLRDLFIHFQKLSKAEKQSMIFNVAGRRQAARLAAILDSYVKSQVLAIQAQLNLNSAEEENILITATLKSQFMGLTAEFERFAAVQSRRGPALALSGMTKALKNLLSLMNTNIGSGFATAMIAVTTVLSAKLLVTAIVAAKASTSVGLLANTARALAAAMVTLRASLAAAVVTTGRLGAVTLWATRAIASAGIATVFLTRAVKLLNVVLGTLMRIMWPLLIIAGAIWLFNKAMDGTANAADSAVEEIAQFNKSLEVSKNNAEAAARGARLFQTAIESIKNGDLKDQKVLLDGVAEAAHPQRSGETRPKQKAREARIDAQKEAFALAREAAKTPGSPEANQAKAAVTEKLQVFKQNDLERETAERQKHFELLEKQDRILEKKQRRIVDVPFVGGFSEEAKMESLKALEVKRNELVGKRLEIQRVYNSENEKDLETWKRKNTELQGFIEGQNQLRSELGSTYSDVGSGGNILADFDVNKKNLDEVVRHNEQVVKTLKEKRKVLIDNGQAESSSKSDLDEELRGKRKKIFGIQDKLTGDGSRGVDPEMIETAIKQLKGEKVEKPVTQLELRLPRTNTEGKIKFLQKTQVELEKIKVIETEILVLEERMKTAGTDKSKGINEKIKSAKKELEAAKIAADAGGQNRDMRVQRLKLSIAQKIARAEIGGFRIGESDPEKRLAQQVKLKDEQAQLLLVPQGDRSQNEQVRLYTIQKQLQNNLIEGRIELIALAAEEENLQKSLTREYQRSLLTAGPAELLRKLAVNQMAGANGDNLNAGQFFAMGQGGRQDFMGRPNQNPRLRQIRRDLAANGQEFGRGGVEGVQGAVLDQQARMQIPNVQLPHEIEAAEAPRTEFLNSIRVVVASLTVHLSSAGAAVEAFAARVGRASANIGNPQVPAGN
jgi:TP901 family phage tail tape measure protein